MSNNYWSDDSDHNSDEELKQDSRELPPIEIDSEEEEEYNCILQMITDKIQNNNILELENFGNDNNIKISNKKKNSNKSKKVYLDLSKNLDNKKTWASKRMKNKKGINNIIRKFNPRLPPPGIKFKNNKIIKDTYLNLDLDFPSL